MKALLWKEWMENRMKLVMVFGGIVALQVFRMKLGFEEDIVQAMMRGLYLNFGGIASILLAMGLVSSERRHGTLNFTLAQPVSPIRFLLAKFAVGTGIVFALHALFWVVIYGYQEELAALSPTRYGAHAAAHLLSSIPLTTMVLLSFPLFWMIFSITFAWSTVTARSDVASMGGLISTMIVFAVLFMTGGSMLLEHWGIHGHILRIAVEPFYVWSRIIVLGLASVGLLVLASFYLRRVRERVIGWAPVIAVVIVFLGGSWAMSEWGFNKHWEDPEKTIELNSAIRDLSIQGDVGYAVIKNGLATLDVSDPANITEHGRTMVEGWMTYAVVAAGENAYVFARLLDGNEDTPDDVGILRFDVSDLPHPRVVDTLIVLKGGEATWRGRPATDGETIYFNITNSAAMEVIAIDITSGRPRVAGRSPVARDVEQIRRHGVPSMIERAELVIHGDVLYVGTEIGINVLDRRDPFAPRLTHEMRLHDEKGNIYGPRKLATSGNRLYVTRKFPQEITVFDITEPTRPVEISFDFRERGTEKLYVDDGYLLEQTRRNRIRTYRIVDDTFVDANEVRVDEETVWQGQGGRLYARQGRLIAVMGTKLIVHPLQHGQAEATQSIN